jgi:NADH-quinone oxidoreductase subunit K|uniref:NADH dehydrogenase subunit 4L n=1 Tax=Leucocryptos marina TaxID=299206 RepID=A0A679ELJ8_LEUMA|nr:NADH dehydrogenase subunit 4L [Leucocryptos marina]BBQ05380.1 NADH dehydrogenase subunit 4L [Leucocryptos marina]
MISVSVISILNFVLFCIGIFGIVFNYSNLLSILMSMELMLLSINLQLIVMSLVFDDLVAQVFALLILTIAAAEAAIGLALVVIFYRLRGTVSLKSINLMKG